MSIKMIAEVEDIDGKILYKEELAYSINRLKEIIEKYFYDDYKYLIEIELPRYNPDASEYLNYSVNNFIEKVCCDMDFEANLENFSKEIIIDWGILSLRQLTISFL